MSDKMFNKKFNLNSDDFADFMFCVNGQVYKVHRVTLAAQSEVFYNIFKTHEKEYLIDDVSDESFGKVIKFIYTGQVDMNENNEEELMKAATKFEIKSLIRLIQLRRNLRINPLAVKELDNLKLQYDEIKFLYEKAQERLSIRNPFTQPPSRYY